MSENVICKFDFDDNFAMKKPSALVMWDAFPFYPPHSKSDPVSHWVLSQFHFAGVGGWLCIPDQCCMQLGVYSQIKETSVCLLWFERASHLHNWSR